MEQRRGAVLIAEDNQNLASALARFLTSNGYEVSTAADGVRALQLFSAAPPDLLVLDLRLPLLSGVEVLRKIRASARGKELPVVIISGAYRGEKFLEGARRLGVRHCL
ncbi:MAG TPA: response regulator, partial [Verrucomicrobiae bacterium]|nr:response regulator [Verrucomicrobiae bacterium]